eukprot:CAMPEP_0177673130 /NCGR_PEP_ID=MMETSP0447-20121125/25757_1 /TAXON_ID=0 /ORGANISM="Stygamoeba regulata, Strain BSH-02190019" /LENGTH=581 /DNA_ID=CAMNT_0019180937 /DNA_START=30 /DNA_END=1775 /DNA_ORIENTATION=+
MKPAVLLCTIVLACLGYVLAATPTLQYAKGDSFHSDFRSVVSAKGSGQADTSQTQASSLTFTATLTFTVVNVDDTSYMFQMDTKEAAVSSPAGPVADDGTFKSAFSNPFFFNMNHDGVVSYVASKENNTEVLSIKKGIVASMQTKLVEEGSSSIHTEVDVIGTHKSTVSLSAVGDTYVVKKAYMTSDFEAFPDSSINKDEISVQGGTTLVLSKDGKFKSSSSKLSIVAFVPKDEKPLAASAQELSVSMGADGENTIQFGEVVKASGVRTYSSYPEWFAANPEYIRQPLQDSVPLGWKININEATRQASDDNTDYPYNKDFPVDKMLGSKDIGVSFHFELFAGTNFDCKHDYFNYKLLGEAQAQAYLFGTAHNLLDIKMDYGRDNGTALDDGLFVTLWNKQVYSKTFPPLTDCQEHDAELAHADPGFSLSHTVHLSIVPVTFAANADANMKLTWGYNLCDAKLSAEARLVPTLGVTVGGSAELSILIAKAGVQLGGGVNADVTPQVYLHGSQCVLGFDVVMDGGPVQVAFDGYYQFRKCHWFSCSWGDKNTKEFFKYSLPQSSTTLLQKEVDIKSLMPSVIA